MSDENIEARIANMRAQMVASEIERRRGELRMELHTKFVMAGLQVMLDSINAPLVAALWLAAELDREKGA